MVNHKGKWFKDSTVLDVYYFIYAAKYKGELSGHFRVSYVMVERERPVRIRKRLMDTQLWVTPIKNPNLLEILTRKAIRGILNNADIRL